MDFLYFGCVCVFFVCFFHFSCKIVTEVKKILETLLHFKTKDCHSRLCHLHVNFLIWRFCCLNKQSLRQAAFKLVLIIFRLSSPITWPTSSTSWPTPSATRSTSSVTHSETVLIPGEVTRSVSFPRSQSTSGRTVSGKDDRKIRIKLY